MYLAVASYSLKNLDSASSYLPRISPPLSRLDLTPLTTHAQLEVTMEAERSLMRLVGPHLGIVEGGRDVRVARRNATVLQGTLDSTASACDEVADRKTSFFLNRQEADASIARRELILDTCRMLAYCGSVESLVSHLADVLEASCFEIADCQRWFELFRNRTLYSLEAKGGGGRGHVTVTVRTKASGCQLPCMAGLHQPSKHQPVNCLSLQLPDESQRIRDAGCTGCTG